VWRAECLATKVSADGGDNGAAAGKACDTTKAEPSKCHCGNLATKINGKTKIGGYTITGKFANVCQAGEWCISTSFSGAACFKQQKICPDTTGQSKLKEDCLCANGADGGPLSKKDITANIPQEGQACKKDQYCSVGIDTITDELKGFTLSETTETQSRHDKAAADDLLLNKELGRKQWASCDAALAKVCPDRTGSTKIAERCKCGPTTLDNANPPNTVPAKVCNKDSYCTVYWAPAADGNGVYTSEDNFVTYGTESAFCSTTPYQNSLLASGRGPVAGVVLAVVLGALAL